jgi:hypothetical protein
VLANLIGELKSDSVVLPDGTGSGVGNVVGGGYGVVQMEYGKGAPYTDAGHLLIVLFE